jgi:hypothetical protein
MKRNRLTIAALVALLMLPSAAFATNTVLSGIFDGTESRTDPLPGACGGTGLLGYQDSVIFQVSADGTYMVFDVFNVFGADVTPLVYEGTFDPDNPAIGLLTPDGINIDSFNFVDLIAGVNYNLVVQHWCDNVEGAWAVSLSGPGNVTADNVRTVPGMTQGLFSDSDPVAETDCTNTGQSTQYQQSGPVNVALTGTYYYTDVLIESDIDVCLQVYTAPFDPANPNDNRVGNPLDDFSTIDLVAGQDYYFVVQPLGVADIGEYFYVLAPPAPFRINKALAGAWFNPETNGQGFFIDVYNNSNQMFAGWYTFDLSRPVDGSAELGEPGHRWLTALGPFDGQEANLTVYLAKGGAFDSTTPPIDNPQTVVGTMTVEFTTCKTGQVDYALTTPVVSGQIPVQPLANEHVELCESFNQVPGMPGPL